MIVVVKKKFKDKKENIIRHPGDTFEVTKSRFAELNKIPGYVEEVVEKSKESAQEKK